MDYNIIAQVMRYLYLGVNLITHRDLWKEVFSEITKAMALSGCLRDVIWRNEFLNIENKAIIYGICYLILTLFGIIMACSSFLIFAYDPLQYIIKKVISLAPGSIIYNIWTAPPYQVFVKCFIFNMTNPAEFLSGKQKMNLDEIGPYVYREILTNEESHFNENGTLTFAPKRRLELSVEESIRDPRIEKIQVVNIPLLGITAALHDSSMFINMGIAAISTTLKSQPIINNLTVQEYLWGYDDRLVTMANDFIPSWINFPRFGIMDRLMALDNGNNTVTIMVNPSVKLSENNILSQKEKKSLYHIQRFNGSPGLHHWGFRDVDDNKTFSENCRCNLIEGAYEGGIFPPNIKANTSFRIYRRAFCRPVTLNFDEEIETKDGYKAFQYRVDSEFLGTPEDNPDNACYCYKGKCPLKGLGHLAPCYYNIPIMISQPHFYNADPSLISQVDGLKPDREKHDSTFVLHPDLGVPLSGSLRIQINLAMPKTRFNSKTRPFNDITIPLFWIELYLEDAPKLIHIVINALYYYLPVVETVAIWLLGILGLSMIGTGALLAFFFPQAAFEDPFLNIDYSPIKIIPMTTYFKPDLRISK